MFREELLGVTDYPRRSCCDKGPDLRSLMCLGFVITAPGMSGNEWMNKDRLWAHVEGVKFHPAWHILD